LLEKAGVFVLKPFEEEQRIVGGNIFLLRESLEIMGGFHLSREFYVARMQIQAPKSREMLPAPAVAGRVVVEPVTLFAPKSEFPGGVDFEIGFAGADGPQVRFKKRSRPGLHGASVLVIGVLAWPAD
jgi:hypothetical protein